MNNIKRKMNILKEKRILYKIRQILLEEENNEYYQNSSNIKDIIDIGTTNLISNEKEQIDEVKNIFIYENGYIKINNFKRKIINFPSRNK